LRDDIDRFKARGAQVVAIAPGDADGVRRFVQERPYPFPVLADTEHRVFDAYDVVARMSSLGQRPAVFVVGRDGVVRFDSIGTQQWQIPSDDVVLAAVP
jgi:peroxiredoxin Q/BCP